MQADKSMLAEFEERFQKIHDGVDIPRPGMFGYSRVARQVHKLEIAVTYLIRQKQPKFPMPAEPETAYELWLQKRDDDELGDVFGDIFKANPTLFNGSN